MEANPQLKITDRLTQRGVAYRLRIKMIAEGFEPGTSWATTMDTMTGMIIRRCKEIWGKLIESI